MIRKVKISKKYMYCCSQCDNLSFNTTYCERCGGTKLFQTPRRYGLTNYACISKSVTDFETMKKEYINDLKSKIS